ncbi:hypothetical protein SAI_0383 [Streptococcus agalactiae H36B]|nr:hypothetical protein SAI_0383 [Streptococcus agalactiae H36B]
MEEVIWNLVKEFGYENPKNGFGIIKKRKIR